MRSSLKVSVLILFGVAVLFMVLGISPQRDSILGGMFGAAVFFLNIVWGVVLVITFLAAAFCAGLFAAYLSQKSEIQGLGSFLVALVYSVVAGTIQIVVFQFLLNTSTQFFSFMSAVHGAGPFETPPVGWAVFGLVAYLAGYALPQSI